MKVSTNALSLRKQEIERITRRISDTEKQLNILSERLFAGTEKMTSSQWDTLLAQYNSALRRYDADETYLTQLTSKAKLSDEDRERTNKKDYKRNYKY